MGGLVDWRLKSRFRFDGPRNLRYFLFGLHEAQRCHPPTRPCVERDDKMDSSGRILIVEESRIGLILMLLREGSTRHAVKVYQEEADVSFFSAQRSVYELARQHGINAQPLVAATGPHRVGRSPRLDAEPLEHVAWDSIPGLGHRGSWLQPRS